MHVWAAQGYSSRRSSRTTVCRDVKQGDQSFKLERSARKALSLGLRVSVQPYEYPDLTPGGFHDTTSFGDPTPLNLNHLENSMACQNKAETPNPKPFKGTREAPAAAWELLCGWRTIRPEAKPAHGGRLSLSLRVHEP